MKFRYQSGDCFPTIRLAAEQKNSKAIWREEADKKRWTEIQNKIVNEINHLWVEDGRYISFWEQDWFPGYEDFLADLQLMGYHIYRGSAERRGNVGLSQDRFCIYLDALPDTKEWSKDGNT